MEDFLINKTILIVDDTPENIDVLNGLLADFKRKIATNGERALKIAFSDNPPNLILLDIMMPGMDGYEVCRRLRENENTKEIPVIFLTAKASKEDVIEGLKAGGQDYVTKPFNAIELMERVKTQLKLQHQQELLKNMNDVLEQKVQERTAQLKESNESLDNANKQLLVLDEAKNQFLMLISHEIRTPLNGIVGSTYFLNDMIDDPELKDFLDMLKESVDRLDSFSKKALEITQMQTVGDNLKKSSTAVNTVVDKVIDESTASATEKNIAFTKTYSGDYEILVVESHFMRTIEELIGNAVKFADKNTGINVLTSVENGKLSICVADKGEVIPADKIEEITKPFGLGKPHYDKNIGLGLNYIQTFLNLHNASMKISSNAEETRFTLIFDLS